MQNKPMIAAVAAISMLAMGTASAKKLDAGNDCAIQKQKIAAEYFSCLFKVDFTSSKSDPGGGSSKPCDGKFDKKWSKLETATLEDGVTPACPADVDTTLQQDGALVRQSLTDAYDAYRNYFLGTDSLPEVTAGTTP
jgi:hypothetical protein